MCTHKYLNNLELALVLKFIQFFFLIQNYKEEKKQDKIWITNFLQSRFEKKGPGSLGVQYKQGEIFEEFI